MGRKGSAAISQQKRRGRGKGEEVWKMKINGWTDGRVKKAGINAL